MVTWIKQSDEQKFQTVIQKNTFFSRSSEVEEEDEASVTALVQSVLNLRRRVELEGCREEIFLEYLRYNPRGLEAILTLTGLSLETLRRVLTIVQDVKPPDLRALLLADEWRLTEGVREWSLERIQRQAQDDPKFAEGLMNLFFRGGQCQSLQRILPLFEFKKLDICKLSFSEPALIDTLVRYRVKGSLKAGRIGNPERVIERILAEERVTYERGRLPNVRRVLDFIVPEKQNPKIVIECSYVVTTSSGMGDKAKTEKEVRRDLNRHYRGTLFFGFVDGIGWYVRKSDLRRIVQAFDDVFTFADTELTRFRFIVRKIVNKRGDGDVCRAD